MDSAEWDEKMRRLLSLLEMRKLDGVLLTKSSNVAWLSGGGQTYINIASEGGVGSLLVIPDRRYLLTDTIEAERLRDEEGFGAGGWEIVAEPWQSRGARLAELTSGLSVGTDQPGTVMQDISSDVAHLRWSLTPPEIDRFRALGSDAGAAIGVAARAVRPGMTEFEIAGLIADATYRRGAVPVVVLVATDERMMTIRHPLPTAKVLERSAMLVLCARRHGLIASVTRLVHFGSVPEKMCHDLKAVATVDAATIQATRPGAVVGDIFATLQQAYADVGFPGEWQYHHQGGAAGYEGRDYFATPTSTEVVQDMQVFAWNPSVPGAKSEDTFLVGRAGAELLTPTPDWPQIRIILPDGNGMDRPDILQL